MIVIHVDFKDDEIIEVVAGRKSLWGDDEEFQILHLMYFSLMAFPSEPASVITCYQS